MTRFVLAPLALLLVFASACSSDDSDKSNAVKLDGLIHATVLDEASKGVPGARLCVVDRPEIPCVKSDDLGIGDLKVPKDVELVLSIEKAGYLSKRFQIISEESLESGLNSFGFQSVEWFQSLAGILGGSIDLGLGMVSLQTDPIEGVKFDLTPKSGSTKGPVQLAFEGTTPVLCTPSATTCQLGVTGYFDVPAGDYPATFSAPDKTCTPKAFACKDGTPACVELKVVPGTLTYASMPCQ